MKKASPHPPAPCAGPSLYRGEGGRKVCVGRIAGAHGVRGDVKIVPYCEDPALLEKVEGFGVRILRGHGNFLLAEIEGITDREAAMALKGTELWIERSALPEPEEEEYYFEDLKGLEVRGADGLACGKVVAVQDFGATPLLEIRPVAGASYYLPFTKEYVPEVNLAGGFVSINPPEGLID